MKLARLVLLQFRHLYVFPFATFLSVCFVLIIALVGFAIISIGYLQAELLASLNALFQTVKYAKILTIARLVRLGIVEWWIVSERVFVGLLAL